MNETLTERTLWVTCWQIRSHAQKYFAKLKKDKLGMLCNASSKRASKRQRPKLSHLKLSDDLGASEGQEEDGRCRQRPIPPALSPSALSSTCVVCRKDDNGDQILLCDGCDSECHTYCAGLEAVPDGDWFCANCTATRSSLVRRQPFSPINRTNCQVGATDCTRAGRRVWGWAQPPAAKEPSVLNDDG